MILLLHKNHRITPPNTREATSRKRLSPLGRIALLAAVGILFLSGVANRAGAAGLKWERSSQNRNAAEPVVSPTAYETPHSTSTIRDTNVVATAWEEADASEAQESADRSVVVRRSKVTRLAQRNEDPFEDFSDVPDFDVEEPAIEEVEEAVETELERREVDPFDEPIESTEEVPSEEDSLPEVEEIAPPEQEAEPAEETADDLFDEPSATVLQDEDALFEGVAEEMDETEDRESALDVLEESRDEDPLEVLEDRDLDELFNDEVAPEGEADEYDDMPLFEEDSEQIDGAPTADDMTQEQLEELAKERKLAEENCREEFARFKSDRIGDIDLSLHLKGDPGKDYPFECKFDPESRAPRQWPQITYTWKAAALCHKPLYFEQVQLERYGHSWGPYVQPIMSGVHFFGTLPILPYKMGIRTPCECVYTLGYYRPGSCAPYLVDPIPFTWRAALFEAGAATGISFAIP